MLKVLRNNSLLLLLCCTSACVTWPPTGQGGLAEHNLQDIPDGLTNSEYDLFFEQDLSRRHLDTLILAGAEVCFPASIKTAQDRANRISRALQGGLEQDASNDLIVQRDKLAMLERRLNYVKQQGSCPSVTYLTLTPANQEQPSVSTKDQLAYILTLLNNNNQFAVNSSELNPRYIGHLAEAAVLLRGYPEYLLKLTGHTDKQGSDAGNQALSLARAQQVARYLQIFGLRASHISVHASAAKQPLFSGDGASVRIVNRRVTIELETL